MRPPERLKCGQTFPSGESDVTDLDLSLCIKSHLYTYLRTCTYIPVSHVLLENSILYCHSHLSVHPHYA